MCARAFYLEPYASEIVDLNSYALIRTHQAPKLAVGTNVGIVAAMPLSDTSVRNAKPRDRDYKLFDSEGLHLLVKTTGSRLWRLAYRFEGKPKTLSIGKWPAVSLPEARAARLEAKKLLARGVDPSARKKVVKQLPPSRRLLEHDSFETVAREWFEVKKARWVPAYGERILSRLEGDVFPEIGHMRMRQVEPLDILHLLRKVEARGAIAMAKRIRQYVGSVFKYGVATARCARDPSLDIVDALQAPSKTEHRAALKFDELEEFFLKLLAYDGLPQTRLAIELVMHTFVRTSELIGARKSEFTFLDKPEKAIWRVPADRMKVKREHIVPLSPRACELVLELKRIAKGNDYLVPNYDGQPLSSNTMLFALYRMGYHSRATIHGFRTLASTSLNEAGFNRDWIERQLAHVPGDTVRAAYNAAEWLPDRRKMMNWWSEQLERQRALAELLS